jgi:hypothetical protein
VQQDGLLNVGFDLATGEAVSAGEGTYDQWRAKGHSGDRSLICLYCYESGTEVPLVISGRVGGRKRRHFRHPPGTAHGGHSPETIWHADGKHLIARWAIHQAGVAEVHVEWRTPDHRRRADVQLTMDSGARVVVELQSRLLTDGDWCDRHRDYRQQDILDVWLWHPRVDMPWILTTHHVPVWHLDVAERSIGIPLGRAHPQRANWCHYATNPAVYVVHHPPCLNDPVNLRWYRLDRIPLDPTGLHLPTELADQLATASDRQRTRVRQTRAAYQERRDAGGGTSPQAGRVRLDPGRPPTRRPQGPPPPQWNSSRLIPPVMDARTLRWPERAWTCPTCGERTRLLVCLNCHPTRPHH